MKKSLCILLLVLTGWSAATAQTEKGRWTVGANVGSLSYQDQNTYKTFTVSLTPSAGYFLTNGLLLGTGVPLSLTRQTGSGITTKYTTSGIGLSPFLRYYFGATTLKPYVGISYSYVHNRNTYVTPYGDAAGTGHTSTIAPSIGLAYFISRNIALNAGLSYNIITTETPYVSFSGQASPAPTIVSGKNDYKLLSLGIGFQLFFGK